MEKTGIIWTEKTWNPVTGCKQISEGCRFCYAKTIAENYGSKAWPNKFGLTLREHKLNQPLKWKDPSIIFVNSMSDVFWDQISDDYRDEMFEVMRIASHHQYQVLTKRPEKMVEYFKTRKVPDNVWLGVTVENQKNVERIKRLKQVDCNIRFVSFEPLIGEINADLSGIHWAITGGESGNHLWKKEWQEKRSLVEYKDKQWVPKENAIQWVNSILNQCRIYNTAFFHKQWGGNYPEAGGRLLNGQFYNEMPRFADGQVKINNAYLDKIMGNKGLNG